MKMWFLKERIDHIKGLTYLILPEAIKRRIWVTFDNKKTQQRLSIYQNHTVSKEDVYAAFAKMNIHGDLFVHSSLIDIGNVKGGRKTFSECLDKYVLDKGNTLLLTAIPVKGSSLEYLKSIKSFDKDAPVAMGAISKHYSLLKEAKRSLEPTHSVVAIGLKAEYYTEGHHTDTTPFQTHSPYYKLYKQKGQIIMIGAGFKHLTIAHLVEDLLGDLYPFNVYTRKAYPVDIVENGEVIYKGKYKAHNLFMGSLRSGQYIVDKLAKLESTQIVPIGASELILLDARDVVDCYLRELANGHSVYGFCIPSKKCKRKIMELLNQQ